MARATTALKATGDPPPEDVQTVPAEGAWHRPAPASETTPAPNSAAAASERVSLALAPAGRRERRIALAVVILSALAFIAAVPFARLPLPRVPAFIASYEAALAINDAITFVLLWGQFQESRSRAVLALACGYFFDALMMVPHALSFPGAFATTGLLGAGSQTTAWLYAFWHGGFPLFVIAYTRLRGRAANGGVAGWSVALGLLGVAGGVCALTVLTTAGQALLPTVIDGIHYAPAAKFVLAAVWAVSLVALVVLWRRKPHSIIDLWLMVVMCAWLFDIALSAVLNSGRFDLGFYAGRLYGLMAASFVLAALLFETNGLHRRLAKATAQLEGQARNLAASVRERTIELQQSNESLKSEIAERQRAEAQLVQAQKMEAIGNLTGGMAHDFNNLLGIIIGNLDTLRERKSVDCDVKELGGEALDAAIRGADLTRRLLAFARRQPLQPQRIALDELIAGNAKLLRRTLGEHIEISLEAAADLWPVIADPAQLEASLTNLATNARDAMPKGGRLMIATANRRLDADYAAAHAEVTPGDYAMIEVSDTGSGMTKEVLSRIFEPFYTTKERDKGTGLGLSMVFGFMKQSGGHINVYSEVGVGTTFRLYLPRAAAAAKEQGRAPAGRVAGGAGETVLVVEDNAGMRRIVVRQLRDLGFRVLEAENGAAGLAILEQEPVALLLTDVVMPGATTGFDLAHIAQKRWPEMRVVLTSGFPEAKVNGNFGPAAAPARMLVKPYRKDELARMLREALAG